MIAFFGVTSLFGTLLFLLLILIAAVQKKPVKVPAIGAGICFVVLLVALIATPTPSKTETTSSTEPVSSVEPVPPEQTETKKAEPEAKEPEQKDNNLQEQHDEAEQIPEKTEQKENTASAPLSDTVSEIEKKAKKDFGENCNVNYDENTVTVNIWPDGVGNEAYYASTGDAKNINAWSKRVYKAKDYVSIISNELAKADYTGMSVVVNVLNDQNTENNLLTVKDGNVEYNWVESDEALSNDSENITVYITDTGKKYHTKACNKLDESQYPISLEDAINEGYGPCGLCNPPIK